MLLDVRRRLGCDGKAIDSRGTGRVSRTTGETSDPDADLGCHETGGTEEKHRLRQKLKRWLGYGLHLIAGIKYEIPVATQAGPDSHCEQVELRALIHRTFAGTPELAER